MKIEDAAKKLNLSEASIQKLTESGILPQIRGEVRASDLNAIHKNNVHLSIVSRLRRQDVIESAAREAAVVARGEKRERLFRELTEAKQNSEWESAVRICDAIIEQECEN